jgi:ATP-binding cassette subfamily B protein
MQSRTTIPASDGRPPNKRARRPGGMGGAGDGQRGDPRMLLRAIRYIGRYRRVALLAYGSLVIATLAQLVVPQLLENLIDAVTGGATAKMILALPAAIQGMAAQQMGKSLAQVQTDQSGATNALLTAGFAIVGFAVVRAVFAFSQSFNSERISQNIAFDFRNELFAKIQRLSFSYHDRNQTGQLMIRATDDVEKVRLFVGQGLVMFAQSILLLTSTIIVLLFSNVSLTMVIVPILPIVLIVFFVFGAIAQPLFMQVQIRVSKLNTILQENLAGLKVVRAFAREPHEQKRFDVAADDLMNQHLRVARIFSFLFPVIFLIVNLGQAAIMYFAGRQIVDGTLTIGGWQKFTLYLMFVFFPLGQLGFIINLVAQASASATRIFEILDAKNDVEDRPNATVLASTQGSVVFDNVTFRYFKGGEPVLDKVSFEALPGQTVALLGATGSGKTTIVNLLPRFYDVSEGRVLIDGRDVRDVTLESLRAQIGIVLQETTLFGGTIRENIAFGRPDASIEEVTAAAQAAAAHDFIMEFPQGYETRVGERGATLSGGQKQRVAIARALLMNPRILILDDSTSSVDFATEAIIQKALDKLMQGRTSFVIAQRISTVRNADQILVMEKGRIVASGRHEELMETSEIYAEIYTSQLLGDSDTQSAAAGSQAKEGVLR